MGANASSQRKERTGVSHREKPETPPTFHLGVSDIFPGLLQDGSVPFDLPNDRTSLGSQRTGGSELQPQSSWQEMEGPTFNCAYLGFTAVSKPPTNVGVLQSTVRDLYYKFSRTSQAGRSASIKLTQKGVLVVLFEDGAFKAELFFEFSSVTFVDTVRFAPVRASSERKPKALFLPVDESRPVQEKNAFLVDKHFHYLISSTHPPLVVCVVRRPQGVKALDCHVFALDSIENALHIAALISSAQTGVDDRARSRGSFERNLHGRDVIRTENGEYSVYRGPQGYGDGRGSQVFDERRFSQGYEDRSVPMYPPPGGRNSYGPASTAQSPVGGVPGSIILTQEDFHRSRVVQQQPQQPISPYSPTENPAHATHTPYVPPAIPGSAPQFRLPDILDGSTDSSHQRPHYEDPQRPHYEDPVVMRSVHRSESSHSNPRHSSGGYPSGGPPPVSARPTELHSTRYPSGGGYPPSRPESTEYSPSTRNSNIISPRSPPGVFTPTSPLASGPVFSASNRESRGEDVLLEEEKRFSGKPVAKVPPHMKAGIKVLPSDFRAVKLKHKVEKKSDSDDSSGYDNNQEIMAKYRELQERGSGGDRSRIGEDAVGSKAGHYPDGERFRDLMNPGRHEHERDWDESGRQRHEDPMTRSSGVTRGHVPEGQSAGVAGKEAEIADMFTNFRLQSEGSSDAVYRKDRSDFEQGLGYLP